jgi:hypothetical protein
MNRRIDRLSGVTDLQLVTMAGDALLEQRRMRQREWYARNRERILAQARARRAADRERVLEQEAERRERNHYKIAAYHREWYARAKHGGNVKDVRAAMWRAQNGRCYLCEKPLGPDRVGIIEHDHRCCPPNKSCAVCRRGLACEKCNWLIALADDNPETLELIAINLRMARASVTSELSARGLPT